MKKCLRISLSGDITTSFLQDTVLLYARNLSLEGIAQHVPAEGTTRIVVCGDKDSVEKFLDRLHSAISDMRNEYIEVEPFLKDKDYRGVFRVIE